MFKKIFTGFLLLIISTIAISADTKFSQFANGGATVGTDIVVGLRAGVNTQFTAPTGRVTSVGLTMPDGWAASGSPITTAGTFGVTTDWKINLARTSPQVVVGFSNPRRPSTTNDVEIAFSTTFTVNSGCACSITLQISPNNSTWQTVYGSSRSEPTPSEARAYSKIIQRSYYYRIINNTFGSCLTSLSAVTELPL